MSDMSFEESHNFPQASLSHGNTKISDEQLQKACYAIHRRQERVTIQKLKEELGGKGSAQRIANTVRWFNHEQLPKLNGSNEEITTSLQSNQTLSVAIAELESNFYAKEAKIKADYAQKTQTLETEY